MGERAQTLLVQVRVAHVAVEHHPVGCLREHRRVRGAQRGAVGVAQVAGLLLAQRRPDAVEVAGHVRRRHVAEQPVLVVGCALLGRGLDDLRLLDDGGVVDRVRRDVAEVVATGGEPAVDAGRVAHSPGVHADQVVGVQHAVRQAPRHQERGLREPGSARATRVEQEHAAALRRVVAGHPGDLELYLLAVGVGVVQRHGHLGAGQDVGSRLGDDVGGTLTPLDLRGRLCGGLGVARSDGGSGGHRERAGQAEHGQQGHAPAARSSCRMQGTEVGWLHVPTLRRRPRAGKCRRSRLSPEEYPVEA